jgi:hypothetical protein
MPPALPHTTNQKSKSFLLLFFKKEALAFLLSPQTETAPRGAVSLVF